jgi:Protein of unknown function (DUF3052)
MGAAAVTTENERSRCPSTQSGLKDRPKVTLDAMSAGYAATPLAKKLGVKSGHRLLLVHAPSRWSVGDVPERVSITRRRSAARADVIIAFFRQRSTLQHELSDIATLLTIDGSLWLAWPRRAGGHESDITDNLVRGAALPLGLVDVKVAALDEDWSGLKMVWRKELRPGLKSANG